MGSEMCIRDSVGGTVTLDDVSFSTKFAIHSGGDATQVRGVPRYWFPPNLLPTSRLRSYAFGSGIYLIWACGLNAPFSPIPGVGLGGLVPRTESAVLGGLPFTFPDYYDFRTHGPHMRIDDLSALSGRFVARVSASLATVDRCPGHGRALPCLLYTSPSPRDGLLSRMPSSA